MKSLSLKIIQSVDDPECYQAYVGGDFIHTKTTQSNDQGQLKMICFAGINLPHQISNLEQIAHFPIMKRHANVSIVFSDLH